MEPLGNDNFETWKVQIQAVLIKNGLWNYVNGTHVRPEANALQWETEDARAKSEIILAMRSSELKHVKNCETSNEMWKELHNIYQSAWPARKAVLLKSLILLKMESGGDMRQHVDKFFDIADKLNAVEQVVKDDLLSTLLLYSIPEEYEPFRIAIELQDNLPTPDDLKRKLLNEYEFRYRYKRETFESSKRLQQKSSDCLTLGTETDEFCQNNIEVIAEDQSILPELHQQQDTLSEDAPSSEPCIQQELDELRCKYKYLQDEHDAFLRDRNYNTPMIGGLKAKIESAINKIHDDYAAIVLELMQQLAKYEDVEDEQDKQDEQDEQDEQDVEILKDQIDTLEKNLCAKRDELVNTLEIANEYEDDDEQEQSRKVLIELIDCIEKNLSVKRDALEERQQLMKMSTEEPLTDGNAEKALASIAPNHTNSKRNFLLARMKDVKSCTHQVLAYIFESIVLTRPHEMMLVENTNKWQGNSFLSKMLGI